MVAGTCIILRLIAGDCLMRMGEISVQELPIRPAEVSHDVETETVFFP